MNNKLNNNFSLRKLLLTALIAGPLATLPAPLWALPDSTSANLTTSSGVTVQPVGTTTLNITAPDKAVLTWQAFGSGTSLINTGDVLNYFLPSANASVLNSVSGGAQSIINGSIISNGNVYVLNPAGIVIGQTAQINTGGFYASTVAEPSGFFGINGTLSFAGTSTATVEVRGTGTTSGTDAATIQAVGTGNKIYLAGNAVDIQGGKFYGNLFVRSTSTANPLGGASTRIGNTGPVSVNLVGTPLVGGGLDIATGGGNVILTGAAAVAPAVNGGTLTVAPAVASTTGAILINTTGTTVNGNITQGTAAFTANTTGSNVTLNAGTGATSGNITLGAVDFLTVGATGNAIALTDTAGGITLAGTTANGNLSVTSAAGIAQTSGSTHAVTGNITLAPTAGNTVSFTGTGNLTFASIATTSTLTVVSSGDITLPNVTTTTTMSITSSGGKITAGNLTTTSTLTLSAPNAAAGNITANAIQGGTANITTAGNIAVTGQIRTTGGTSNITASTGNITAGSLTTSSTANLTASAGSITVGGVSNSSNPLTLNAANGTVTTGNIAGSNSLTISAGTIVTGNISTSSNTTLTASTGTITTGTITTSSTLSLSAPAAAGTITTGALTSSTTRTVTISSGGSVELKTTTAPVLAVTSSTGSITQAGVVTSTSSATLAAPLGDIILENVGNDFNTVVLTGGAGSTGIKVTDKNDIVLGTGTATLGATTIVAGAGIAAYTGGVPTVAIANNVITATATSTINTSAGGTVTGFTLTGASVGGAGYLAAPTVTLSAPPPGGVQATATATINTSTGVVTGFTITNSGSGYTTAPTVTLAAPTGTASTAVATLSPAGVVTGVTVTPGTAPFASAPAITFTPAVGGAGSGAIATASLTNNLLTAASIVPLQSGSITLGNAAIDTLSFGGTLSLSTTGIGGTNGVTNYSQITTAANNVRIFGAVSIKTNNTNATLGNNTFGNAANYSFGQVNGDVGTGTLSVFESQTINLGNVTAASLDARSLNANIVNTGKLAVTGNAIFAANSIFNPGDVTLTNSTNALSGTVLIGNAKDFTLVNTGATTVTAGTALVNGKAATGTTNVTVTGGALTLNTGVGGDYSTVGFSSNNSVTITDPNGVTIQNATNSGTGTVSVTAAGPIVLGSGIALGSTGGTFISSTGATASVTDSAPGIRIGGNVAIASDNSIAITNAGHSFGAVSLNTTGVNGATGTANITYTEGGSANLNVVRVNSTGNANVPAGSLTVVSSGGDVIQTAAGAAAGSTGTASSTFTAGGAINLPTVVLAGSGYISNNPPVVTITGGGAGVTTPATATATVNAVGQITGFTLTNPGVGYTANPTITIAAPSGGTVAVPSPVGATNTVSFTSTSGAVTLGNAGNQIVPAINVSAVGNSTLTQSTAQNLVLGNVAVSAGTFTAAANNAAAPTITQATGTTAKIFGASSFTSQGGKITLTNTGNNFGGVTASSTNAGAAPAGADIAITEAGTLNLVSINSGTAGKLAATSEKGAIIQTGTAGVIVGGTTALTAAADGVTLNIGTANVFGGNNGITVTTAGNVAIQDANATTTIAGGSTIGGSLTIKNTAGNGTIKDSPGALTVSGNVLFDTFTAGASTGTVNIGSSTASLGAVQFRSGTVTIVENATLNLAAGSVASGAVSLTSSGDIVTSGAGGGTFQSTLSLNATGSVTVTNPIFVQGVLTVRALKVIDLSALSKAGNLNSLDAVALPGYTTYKGPNP